jgi:hypothetical protein
MPLDIKAVRSEIDAILAQQEALRRSSKYDDCSDLDNKKVVVAMITTLAAAIDRFAPPGSRYLKAQQDLLEHLGPTNGHTLEPLAGILIALRDDMSAGRLATIAELLHADIFADFLDMAQHLLDEGYKDAAAVIAGGVLEQHLRKLCVKHGLPTANGGRPKKADTLNSDLAGVAAYSKLDQKNVTAWLGLRNDAAHGNYAAYRPEQVGLLIQATRDFITRVPA